jgi:hypothetical protein
VSAVPPGTLKESPVALPVATIGASCALACGRLSVGTAAVPVKVGLASGASNAAALSVS